MLKINKLNLHLTTYRWWNIYLSYPLYFWCRQLIGKIYANVQSSSEGYPKQDLSYAPAFVPIFSVFFSPVVNTCILCIGAWHRPFWMADSSRKRKRVLITKAETSVRQVTLHFVSFVNGAYWLLWNRTLVRFRTALHRFFTWVFFECEIVHMKREGDWT